MKLDGKIALITGGGAGIGAAIAERFVSDGARLCITGRRKEMLEQVAESLPPEMVTICSGDVSKEEDVKRMVESTVAFGGRLDVLVNNAAMDENFPAGVVDIKSDLWRRIIDVNLTGPFLLMKASIPHMMRVGGGSIINIASIGGIRALPGSPAYCSSKGGLIMLTQQAALDYGSHNIRCNIVCPGGVKTAMIEGKITHLAEKLGTKDMDKAFDLISKNVPLRRFADSHEITGICSYLASDDSIYMTGSVLVIDGGSAIVETAGATAGQFQ